MFDGHMYSLSVIASGAKQSPNYGEFFRAYALATLPKAGRGMTSLTYGILVFVGQGVYVGATGRGSVGEVVGTGEAVRVGKGVPLGEGGRVRVGVEVAVIWPSRLKAKKETASRSRITPAIPPATHGSQSALRFFFTTTLKSEGAETKTTVMLSCPPRELARSTRARVASRKLGRVRTVSRISSFHTRSVKPSLHNSTTSSGRICTP